MTIQSRTEWPKPPVAETCCDNEENHTERETDSGLCPRCHEHADEIACIECGATVFISTCCG